MHTETFSDLMLHALSPEQRRRTCGYWYTITHKARAHTTFRWEPELVRWLSERGLSTSGPIPEQGSVRVLGTYHKVSHMSAEYFNDLQTVCETTTLVNGVLAPAKITADPAGVRSVETLNPNVGGMRVLRDMECCVGRDITKKYFMEVHDTYVEVHFKVRYQNVSPTCALVVSYDDDQSLQCVSSWGHGWYGENVYTMLKMWEEIQYFYSALVNGKKKS